MVRMRWTPAANETRWLGHEAQISFERMRFGSLRVRTLLSILKGSFLFMSDDNGFCSAAGRKLGA
jgi:hypothetical protein